MNWFYLLPWWAHVLIGMAIWFSIQNFVLPDPWSVWLALRKNGPTALLPFAVVALLIGLINVAIWLYKSVRFVWVPNTIAPWLWLLVVFGVIVVVVFFAIRNHKSS